MQRTRIYTLLVTAGDPCHGSREHIMIGADGCQILGVFAMNSTQLSIPISSNVFQLPTRSLLNKEPEYTKGTAAWT